MGFQGVTDLIFEDLGFKEGPQNGITLIGKDTLAETDKIKLETAKLPREDYLAQNAFTPQVLLKFYIMLVLYIYLYGKFCPFYKSVWMMRNIIHFITLANQSMLLLSCINSFSYNDDDNNYGDEDDTQDGDLESS